MSGPKFLHSDVKKWLIASYRKRLIAVVAAKGGTAKLLDLGVITFSGRARQVWTAFFP